MTLLAAVAAVCKVAVPRALAHLPALLAQGDGAVLVGPAAQADAAVDVVRAARATCSR